MANDNNYPIEKELMEAFTRARSAGEIGMPDVEAELLRVRGMARKPAQRLVGRRIASVAACALLLAGVGLAVVQSLQGEKDVCVAYVGGQRITDEDRVMELLHEDMDHLGTENELLEDQLNDFFNE